MDLNKIYKHIQNVEDNSPKVRKRRNEKTYINIGMFIKTINNLDILIVKYLKELEEENINFSEDLLENQLKKIIYARAYDNISKVDITNDSQLKIAFKFNPKLLDNSIQKSIKFFELEEEYEKCQVINNFRKRIEGLRK